MTENANPTTDDLFLRAEKARRDAALLAERFMALRELRALQRDFRGVMSRLAGTLERPVPYSGENLSLLLTEADEILLS